MLKVLNTVRINIHKTFIALLIELKTVEAVYSNRYKKYLALATLQEFLRKLVLITF